jgi:hypothetical protein
MMFSAALGVSRGTLSCSLSAPFFVGAMNHSIQVARAVPSESICYAQKVTPVTCGAQIRQVR